MSSDQNEKHQDAAEATAGKVHVDLTTGDLAAQYLANSEAGQPIDPAVERRVVRKIDMRIIPFICMTYLFTIMDKAILGYAAVFNLKQDIGLVGEQYSWVASIIYFGYLLFEYPMTFAMQKTSVSKWLSANVFIWGGVTMALGGGRNFADFMGLRFALGALEACSTPAFLLLTAMWYTREEQPIRIGWWATFLGVAYAFGGLFAFAIGHIKGALDPWRYQFIVIGAIPSVWGIICYVFLAENAMSASWLTEEEKRVAIERLRKDQTGIKTKSWQPQQVKEAVMDPKTWLYVALAIATMIANSFASNFGSLIVKGFGFSTLNTLLLQIPFGVMVFASNLSGMYLQRWLPGQMRCVVSIMYVIPSLVGAIGVYALPRSSQVGLLICYYLTATFGASYTMLLGLITANTGGSTKRTTVSALFFIAYCAGNIIGPFTFKASEAPVYTSGMIAVVVSFCVEIALFIVYPLYMIRLNKAKKLALAQLDMSEEDMSRQRDANAFNDLTDMENPFFEYLY